MTLASLLVSSTLLAGLSPLSIKGQDFVDSAGKKVQLRGVNLGGWLVEEIWMTPWADKPPKDLPGAEAFPKKIADHVSLWTTVEKRLGKDAMLRVRQAWRESWIQESDFARIRAAGLNHVRLPFLWSILDEPGGMDWLRKAVGWAKKHDLYVVLDLHGAQGGQSGEHHTGEEGKNRLWYDVDNIDKMIGTWKAVAREFANEPTVAAYDLINEPMGTPNVAMLHLVYDRLIRGIRTVDAHKPVIVDDGYKGFETTPHPNLAGWTQVAFSLHFYHFDAKASGDHVKNLKSFLPKVKELQGYRDAPLYIGEFNLEPHGNPEVMHEYVRHLTEKGLNWAMWTYKAVAKGGPMGQWGMYRKATQADALDAYVDSEATLIAKMKQVRTENLEAAPGLLPLVRG